MKKRGQDKMPSVESMEEHKAALQARADGIAEELRRCRGELAQMKTEAFTHGRYAPPHKYRALEEQIRELGSAHQRELRSIAAMRHKIKDARRREESNTLLSLEQHFVNAARDLLEPDIFKALWREATARRSVLGDEQVERSALGALGANAGGGRGFSRVRSDS